MKVQASNFQAEYGRSSGATITVVTKSGTRDFRGTAAYYKRDETSTPTPGIAAAACDCDAADDGVELREGAVPLRQHGVDDRRPGAAARHDFNRNRDKLFFFFSQDLLPRNDPGTLCS